MRRNLFVGLFLAAIVSFVAGEYWINRSGAQDAGKKANSDEKNLFDILKKDLDAKKDTSPAFPPLPVAQPVQAPLPETKAPIAPSGLPPLPKEVSAPPVVVNEPPVPAKPKTAEPKPNESSVRPTTAPIPEPSVKPAIGTGYLPPSKPKLDSIPVQKESVDSQPAPLVSPVQPIVDQVAKLKNCPWSLQVEMVDGQTILTALVNKKHEFRIVCQSLDLQTGKGTLKASGKVQISGDALNGSCEHLAIGLHEDRLVLEGGAEVRIHKLSSAVSDTKPSAFELKGATLNLRISELESSKFLQTSLRRTEIDVNVRQASVSEPARDSKQWSRYGKLVRRDGRLGSELILEDGNGSVIHRLVMREGGTLDQYLGQTISVFGSTERTHRGAVLRVSHIALP